MNSLLQRMCYYGKMSVKEFVRPDDKERRHLLMWPLREYEGFPGIDNNEIGADQSWQFCLWTQERLHPKWRVHGFLQSNTFYVVWFDPNHYLTIDPVKPKKR